MELIFAAIVGWCGTGWPIRFGGGGGGGGDIDPWPPNCWVCGPLVGALAGILTFYALGPYFANAGMLGTIALAFFGGSFGATLVGGILRMVSRK